MKAVRKPLTDEVWHNIAPDEPGFEPMPDWVTGDVESDAAPGLTFMIDTALGRRLVRPGNRVIKGPTDIYPCSEAGFKASYEEPQK